jgi:protein involved in polysaccharide export with SLBB domain
MKRMPVINVFCFSMVSFLVFIQPGRAQDLQLAIANPSYQITAGDVYTLTYNNIVEVITVDYSYRLTLPGLGVINVAGQTYQQLKQEIETIVTNIYPQGGVSFSLTNPSSFSVFIKGEVISAAERTTWALGRLSSLVNSSFTNYSSTRNITVTSMDGQVKTCDLFKAQRFGDLSQDPYLRPGDVITVSHIDRKVSVYGEVERPGLYELLPGEDIRELIHNYANGYTSWGDTGRVELTRGAGNTGGGVETIYLTREDISANYPLRHSDMINVPLK